MSISSINHSPGLSDPTHEYKSMDGSSTSHIKKKKSSILLTHVRDKVKQIGERTVKYGVHSACQMAASGFRYTGDGDTARCDACGIQKSKWTVDMVPFKVHAEQRPNCSFVQSVKQSAFLMPHLATSPSIMNITSSSTSDRPENSFKGFKIATRTSIFTPITLYETPLIQQVRKRTFSHWPLRTTPSTAQMIEAGFFNCNVGDRVICIYCNMIYEQWTPTDNPSEIHKLGSPNCLYVNTKLTDLPTTKTQALTSIELSSQSPDRVLSVGPYNPTYAALSKRQESFATWPAENSTSIDDLVKGGFYYTGTKNIVTCFYCNGSLQDWASNDNPVVEHARSFPRCAFAKQLCGDDLYRKIQESKRAQQEPDIERLQQDHSNLVTHIGILSIPSKRTLRRLVGARLDLPVSHRLRKENFKLSIIKRCWKDQLRLKGDDFVDDLDLYIACLIFQKQIEHKANKEKSIVVPKALKKQIRENNEARIREQNLRVLNAGNIDTLQPDRCVVCLTKKKQMACMPCGHLETCEFCGHALNSCPRCQTKIEAFVRIYI